MSFSGAPAAAPAAPAAPASFAAFAPTTAPAPPVVEAPPQRPVASADAILSLYNAPPVPQNPAMGGPMGDMGGAPFPGMMHPPQQQYPGHFTQVRCSIHPQTSLTLTIRLPLAIGVSYPWCLSLFHPVTVRHSSRLFRADTVSVRIITRT